MPFPGNRGNLPRVDIPDVYKRQVVNEQDQILAFKCEALYHLLKKGLDGFVIFQGGIAQRHKQRMLFAAGDLLSGKRDVEQIFFRNSGQGTPENGQKLVRFFLGHERQRLIQLGEDFQMCIRDSPCVNPQ